MDQRVPVICPENEGVSEFMWQKTREMTEKGISENTGMTLSKAYANTCNSKTPIQTLKELSHVKGVGKWILKLMQEFFETDSGATFAGTCELGDLTNKMFAGKKTKVTKRYLPQKNSVAYALLITLYRGTANDSEFMRKQELIDAAEACGLSRVPIMPEIGKGKKWRPESSSREWYSGWSCMKTLITRGLVVKSSSPAKYMLTQEGHEAALECLSRSGLVDSVGNTGVTETFIASDINNISDSEMTYVDLEKEDTLPPIDMKRPEKPINVPVESFERFVRLGYSKEQILRAYGEVSKTSECKDVSSLWPAVLCCLREYEVYGLHSKSERDQDLDHTSASSTPIVTGQVGAVLDDCRAADSARSSFILRACSTSDDPVQKTDTVCLKSNLNVLSTPPLNPGEQFGDVYEVILILDCREQFATRGSKSKKLLEHICRQFRIKIEVRRLPVGDGIWIARHKNLSREYVLDFIVERKNVDDLRCSIRDNRYRDQKLRILRCGLKKLIYLVEGDPNYLQASESIKTACFTTEILEGFDVQRTSGLGDTLRKYGYLTQAISRYYREELPNLNSENTRICPPLDEFIKRCQGLDTMTVSDVFAVQLMQVPQVTEEVAVAVLDLYPTLISLGRAYSMLEGEIGAQEDLLRRQSKNVVNAAASKGIFQLVWGSMR